LARETTDKATSLFSLHQVILEQEEDKNNIALSQLHKLTAAAAATYFPKISSMSPRDGLTPRILPLQLSGCNSSAGNALSM